MAEPSPKPSVNGDVKAPPAGGKSKKKSQNNNKVEPPAAGSDSVPNATPDKDAKKVVDKSSDKDSPAAPPAEAPVPAPPAGVPEDKGPSEPSISPQQDAAAPPSGAAEPDAQTNNGARKKESTGPIEGTTEEDTTEDTKTTFVSRRSKRYRDPPIAFLEINGVGALKKLMEILQSNLNTEEKQALGELYEYLVSDGGAWALGTAHLDIVGRLLNDRNFPNEVPLLTLQMLQSASLKEDMILLLHQDRKDHHLMNYLYRIEHLLPEEQEEIATLMCNLCYQASTFDWLMYISEWEEEGHVCNNSKVTVRVAVHSLLSDGHVMQDRGSALMYNLALKELFDDTAIELATAVLQFLHGDLKEEIAFRCLTSLLRFLAISFNDVPALVKMLGPDLRKYLGKSERVDQLVEQIHQRLSSSLPPSVDHSL